MWNISLQCSPVIIRGKRACKKREQLFQLILNISTAIQTLLMRRLANTANRLAAKAPNNSKPACKYGIYYYYHRVSVLSFCSETYNVHYYERYCKNDNTAEHRVRTAADKTFLIRRIRYFQIYYNHKVTRNKCLCVHACILQMHC